MSTAPFDLARIGAGLPVAGVLGELRAALGHGAAVVQAPPGTGKTTLVPPLVADLLHERATGAAPGRVVVTQPRRVAARSAARRLAHLAGTRVGGLVGHTVRGDRRAGPGTLVEFVTPGVLLRRLLQDPGLPGTDAVVLDEVHERGLESDLLVGLLAEVRQLREDLVLVAMSATLDAARFAGLLGEDGPAPVVDCPAALHPLTVRWAPAPGRRTDERGATRPFLDHVARTAAGAHAQALARDAATDALVFVPGAWEVAQVARRLRETCRGTEVLELHGRVGAAEQDRATSGRGPGDPPRVVVSTSLAESSLTVPGVRLVVDSGLSREPRRDAGRGMTGLVTVAASRASAEQRAGRAARLGPGEVVRCYDERAWAAMPRHLTPELAAADLTGAALLLACWGAPGGRGLSLPDPLPAPALADALAVLRGLGALDDDGRATATGRLLAAVPVDPRLARGLLDGARAVGARPAAEVVAMVSDDHRPPGGDLSRLLAELRSGRAPDARRWAEEARRLERTATDAAPSAAPAGAGEIPAELVTGAVVALALPERVARKVGDTYLLASGTRAGLAPGSGLAGQEWLAVADVTRAAGQAAAGTGAVVRAAAALDRPLAERCAEHLLTDEVRTRFEGGRASARRVRALGAIELSSTPVRPALAAARAAVREALAEQGLGLLGWSDGADRLRRRLALLHHRLGPPWPDVADAALLDRLDEWLAPELDGLAGGGRADLAAPLRRLLPWPEATRLDELAPERLAVASGSRVRIDYPAADDPAGRPVVSVRLQECFGWAASPTVADGRVPVLFHLLSPAGRPLAVTDDLASFWSGPYAQVRAEMRGRYPKHPWPEDPWAAPATARTARRS
ncbi:ATP-dependent helicase [Kocuria rosea subsp. polaris]|uniref:ATP-dependent helicase n=1 Tax=Kocuria rosea subsp. polaris TaxID=136273 RepID=A0A0W8IQ71_KOCRO|nr:ATP-dependent helicase HrpB [Kocuria polaris]KUG62057.1 ATP-dependent helicase [Kocuria polaris]